MVHYTVLLPTRDTGAAVRDRLPELLKIFALLALPYEIICLDDGSAEPTRRMLEGLVEESPQLRLLRFDHPRGISAALSAGLAVARGELIITFEPTGQFQVDDIPHLIARLSRADLVFGRRACAGWHKAWQRVARLPRWALLGLEVRDPDCLFWVARREAVEGLQLVRGMFRYLPSLVAMRGYRVTEQPVRSADIAPVQSDARPNPADLLAAWWLKRRFQAGDAREVLPAAESRPRVRIANLDVAEAPARRMA